MANKILIITRNLPPLWGGMERLVWHIVEGFSKTWDVSVIGPKGCKKTLPDRVSCLQVSLNPLFFFLWMSKIVALWKTVYLKPQIVFAGSGLTAPIAWLAARFCQARAVVFLHGLDIDTEHPLYNLFWKPFIRRCDIVIVNSSFTRKLAISAGVLKQRIFILHPGVALPDYSKSEDIRRAFRNRYILNDRPLMLYVGRITARKGLAYFIDNIFPKIIRRIPEARLVVLGGEPACSVLKQAGEMVNAEKAIHTLGLKDHVLFLGLRAIDDPEISAAYFASDVHVFPVQKRPHDNEGFGMVALEAAAHGLPTVAFAVGGVSDAVQHGVSGFLIKAGDDAAFADAVIQILSSRHIQFKKDGAKRFAENFEWKIFSNRLQDCVFGKKATRSASV